jgi:hypothetical protein
MDDADKLGLSELNVATDGAKKFCCWLGRISGCCGL